jgi:hypothetical protein
MRLTWARVDILCIRLASDTIMLLSLCLRRWYGLRSKIIILSLLFSAPNSGLIVEWDTSQSYTFVNVLMCFFWGAIASVNSG